MDNLLVTGGCGQLGTELAVALAEKFGSKNVIVSDISPPPEILSDFTFVNLDVLDYRALEKVLKDHSITQVYHLAAMLSAKGEKLPMKTWELNVNGLLNTLKASRVQKVEKFFWPSSIAAFGPSTPNVKTPQNTVMDPNSVYGISKLSGELWCNYYHQQVGLDVRSLRYPGIISYKSPPGGGTTDYAIEMFYAATSNRRYKCFLEHDTRLPMMYMPDAVEAAIQLMQVPAEKISIRTSYNISAMAFTPAELHLEINRQIKGFDISYYPDYRQEIADSWPSSIDDQQAIADWGWKPQYDITDMTIDMIKNLLPLDAAVS